MKNLLLSIFLFISSFVFSQCTYSVWLRDTYGDGWNGGYLQIYINGAYTYGNYTLPSGSGPAIFNFNVFQGQSISVRYYAGSWSSENYYRVYAGPNATGALLISTPTYQTPPMWTYPGNSCSSPLQTQPPSSISPTANNICSNQTVTLTANNSVGTTYWFTNGCSTVGQFATGASVNVNPNVTTTYYARNYANGVWSSSCAQTTITVVNGPQPPTAQSYNTTCGQSISITAQGGSGNYQWWSNSNGTGLLGSGNNYTLPSPTTNSTVYVTSSSAAGGSGTYSQTSNSMVSYNTPGSVTTLVSSTPMNASGNATLTVYVRGDIDNSTEWVNVIGESGSLGNVWGGSQCSGTWTTTTYSIPANTINSWASNGSIQVSFNSSSSVNNICGWGAFEAYFTITYPYSSGCNSQPTAYTVNVNPIAAPTSNGGSTTCGSPATINASGTGTITWYTNSNLTTSLGTGGSYTTPNLTTTTTYYIQSTNGSCVSSATPVTVTVNPLAAPTVNGNSVVCIGNSTTLTASGGNNIVWYSNSNGTGQLGTGSTYTTPQLNNNTTYYVGSQSQPQTQTTTFNINSIGQLVNMTSSCGTGSYYNGCSGTTGFNWNSSLPAGATINTVQIQLSVGVECQAGTRTTTLNNVNGPTFNTLTHCNCSGSINPIFTLNMNPTNYIANGTNQFRIINPPSCFGLFNGSGGLPGNFAKVIVTYTIGSACSSSLAAFPITISNTTQFNQQAMPIMQQPTMVITQHPSGQYAHWYNGFQNDQYIATSSVSTDYLTIRMGQPQGALVAQGTQPVSFNGPATGSYYIHVNTNSNCGNDNQLRTITVNRVSALPVELLSFDGSCNDNLITLNWRTSSEHNSQYFEIQKSRDGENWSSLTTVESAGNSTQELSYETKDHKAIDGNNYYKLIQYDIDGQFKEYGPINVICNGNSKGYFSIFPNPSSGDFQVILNNKRLIGDGTLEVKDSKGSVVYTQGVKINQGINLINVSNINLTSGIYYVSVITDNNSTEILKQVVK
jgi:hypothetical protein